MKVKKLNESAALTEETLEQAAQDFNPTLKKAARRLHATAMADWDGPYGEVEEILDEALKSAVQAIRLGEVSDDNVLLVGRAGTGKTERVKNWCKQRGIGYHMTDVQSLDPTDLAGIIARDDKAPQYATRLGNTEFHELDDPDRPMILFLDEINRASKEVLGALLTLVQNHLIVDPLAEGGKRPLRGMLFTVSAMNPFNPAYDVKGLDMAMLSRHGYISVEAKNEFQKEFFNNYFNKQIKKLDPKDEFDQELIQELKGRLAIANKLMDSPSFRFDDDDDEADAKLANRPSLNPRSLTAALKSCDGTKEHFLKKFMEKCNPAKYEMVEDILEDYIDVDDEANAALAYGDDNPFAEKQKTLWDDLGF